MRVLRYFLVSGAAAVVAGSLTLATQATVTTAAAPDHAAIQPSAHFLAQARAALVSYLSTNQQAPPFTSGNPGAKTVNQPASAIEGTAAASSFNWSGYADVSKTANTFTNVSGQWKTPKVRCTKEDQLTSEWVGIDGYNNGTVEQDGTIVLELSAAQGDYGSVIGRGGRTAKPQDEAAEELTPVMTRLGPADLATVDTLITAGIAGSRAEVLRWSVDRIRENPAYAQIQDRVREINELKARF